MAVKTSIIQPRWFVIISIALVGALIFFWPFLGVVCLAAVLAYCFLRPYRWFEQRMKPGLAATLTMIVSILVVAVPLAIILTIAVIQGVNAASNLTHINFSDTNGMLASIQPTVDTVNSTLSGVNNGQPVISADAIREFVKNTLPALFRAFIDIVIGVAGSIPALMTGIILYGYLFIAFLINNRKIHDILIDLSPFDRPSTKLYIERTGVTIKASIQGQFSIAAILGLSTALLMPILGFGHYFFFFFIIFTLLSMIPLGTGIVVVPLSIIAIIGGEVAQGVTVLLLYLIVVCNMDNILRPMLMPKKARFIPSILVLAIFSGLYYFGIFGLIYGPVIATILMTTLELYREYRTKSKPIPAT